MKRDGARKLIYFSIWCSFIGCYFIYLVKFTSTKDVYQTIWLKSALRPYFIQTYHYSKLQHFSGLEEAVFRNISACKEFSKTLKTAYGPQGRNKMVINHLEKLFVTNDAATIIKELEVNFTEKKRERERERERIS